LRPADWRLTNSRATSTSTPVPPKSRPPLFCTDCVPTAPPRESMSSLPSRDTILARCAAEDWLLRVLLPVMFRLPMA
jgi:hypothetical protein